MDLATSFLFAAYTALFLLQSKRAIKAKALAALPIVLTTLIVLIVATSYWFKPACRAIERNESINFVLAITLPSIMFAAVVGPLLIAGVVAYRMRNTSTRRTLTLVLADGFICSALAIIPTYFAYQVFFLHECKPAA